MSFGVRHVLKKEISGWFRLLSDKAGKKKHCTLADKKPRDSPTASLKEHLMSIMDDKSVSNATDQECSSSISSGIDAGGASSSMEGPEGPRPPSGSSEGRLLGRTPYTVTLEMVKDDRGFGFSVAWTNPPRVERVEAGLPAAKSGMRPGDYLIFVAEDNVVKMAEEKVLQLIQECGNRLVVEVYRKTSGKTLDGLNGISLPSTSKEERPLKSRHGLREMAILNGVQYIGSETPKQSKVAFLRKEAEDEVLASSVSSLATGTGSADSQIYFPPHAGCPVNVTMQDLEDRIVFAKSVPTGCIWKRAGILWGIVPSRRTVGCEAMLRHAFHRPAGPDHRDSRQGGFRRRRARGALQRGKSSIQFAEEYRRNGISPCG